MDLNLDNRIIIICPRLFYSWIRAKIWKECITALNTDDYFTRRRRRNRIFNPLRIDVTFSEFGFNEKRTKYSGNGFPGTKYTRDNMLKTGGFSKFSE